MRLRDSVILQISLSTLLPFILIFGFYLFAYGASFPGGGFQAGVLVGSIVVIIEVIFEKQIFADRLYGIMEAGGAGLLIVGVWYGVIIIQTPFGALYGRTYDSLIFGNLLIFLLNFFIFLEVSGSLILILRHFLEWGRE